MLKKAVILSGVFAVSAMAAATMTFAQTTDPTPTTEAESTVTPTVADDTMMMPESAPSTGRAL